MKTIIAISLVATLAAACKGKKTRVRPPPDAGAVATGPSLDRLPPGLRIESTRVTLKAPLTLYENEQPVTSSDVVELRVTSSEPIPARALDPVLLVGERAVTHYRYENPATLVFTELEPTKLPDSAAIRFAWGREPGGAVYDTGQRFERKTLKTLER